MERLLFGVCTHIHTWSRALAWCKHNTFNLLLLFWHRWRECYSSMYLGMWHTVSKYCLYYWEMRNRKFRFEVEKLPFFCIENKTRQEERNKQLNMPQQYWDWFENQWNICSWLREKVFITIFRWVWHSFFVLEMKRQ